MVSFRGMVQIRCRDRFRSGMIQIRFRRGGWKHHRHLLVLHGLIVVRRASRNGGVRRGVGRRRRRLGRRGGML